MASPNFLWKDAPPEVTLESIFNIDDTLSFLVGAGLSLDPPSCLPSGYQYTKSVLEKIVPEEEQADILKLMNPERSNMRNPGDFLRFEQIMEELSLSYDRELHVLDPLGICSRPNFNHKFLAQMILQDSPVFTTNFDSLIEYGLMSLGIQKDSIIPTIYQQDWEQTSSADKNRYPVYKLHGSLIDIRTGVDTRNSIQATIAQIAEGKEDGFQLEEWEEKVVTPLWQEHDIVVLGYSGLDDFDVLPTLWGVPSGKRILWITHDSNLGIQDAKISIIETCSEKVPLGTHDRTGDNLLLFMQHKTREMAKIIRISVRTDELLKWLWEKIGKTKPIEANTTPCPRSFQLNLSCLNLSLGQKWSFLANLYRKRDLIPEAIKAYEHAITIAAENQNSNIEANALNGLGLIYDNNTEYNKAARNYERAMDIYQKMGNDNATATMNCNLAIIYDKKGEYDKAEAMYRNALKIHQQQNNLVGESLDLSNLATMFCKINKREDAIPIYQKAIKIHTQLGKVRAKAIDMSNLASTLAALGRKEEAKGFYLDAIELHDRIGNIRSKGIDLSNLGSTVASLGNREDSCKYYKEAIEIHSQIRNWLSAVIDSINLGHSLYSMSKFSESITYYDQAIDYCKKMGDNQRIEQIEKFKENARAYIQ